MDFIWEPDSLSATIELNMDCREIGEGEMLNFNGTNEIILYAGLNKTNAEKLQRGQYTEMIIAHEYIDIARSIKQSEVVVEIAYDTKCLFDMLQPGAYRLIDNHIAKNKMKKTEISDMQIISDILQSNKYSGVRATRIMSKNKCYSKTEMVYKDTMLLYFLNPASVKVLKVIEK